MINYSVFNAKCKFRRAKIEMYASIKKVDPVTAAMYIDSRAPLTTSRKMLSKVGYDFGTITLDNYGDVIAALGSIHVQVNTNGHDPQYVITVLNRVVDEEIPEVFSDGDTTEIIYITPDLDGP